MRNRVTRPRGRAALLSLGVLVGCVRSTPQTASAHPEAQHSTAGAATSTADSSGAQARLTRTLAPHSVFADLVRHAEALEGSDPGAGEPAGACLLAGADPGFTLRAPVHQALRPLPQPAADLDGALKEARSAQVLTPWGSYGAEGTLVLASFTAFTPARRALALILTDQGVSVRGAAQDDAAPTADGPPAQSLAALGPLADAIVFVAAEAQVPVSELYRLLEELARLHASVALATVLPARTRMPSGATRSAPGQACPDGLSATDAAEGDLSRDAVLSGLSALRERVPDCLLRGDAAGAAGGQLVIALRIDAAGQVPEACLVRDDVADPAVGACALELARGLRFSPPNPAGVVDVQLPLVLRPHSAPAPRPVCAPTEPR